MKLWLDRIISLLFLMLCILLFVFVQNEIKLFEPHVPPLIIKYLYPYGFSLLVGSSLSLGLSMCRTQWMDMKEAVVLSIRLALISSISFIIIWFLIIRQYAPPRP